MEVQKVLPFFEFRSRYIRKGAYLRGKGIDRAANVLLSRKFYYFGDKAIDLPNDLQHIIIRGRGCKRVSDGDIAKLNKYLKSRPYGTWGSPIITGRNSGLDVEMRRVQWLRYGHFMSKLFLINVGANKSHASIARSPIFPGHQFVYISFPSIRTTGAVCPYPPETRPYLRPSKPSQTHLDPDWKRLTYGDYLHYGRAAALRRAVPGDILLFWGLLWRNNGRNWGDFTGEYGWYFIGALRIEEILDEGQTPADANHITLEGQQRTSTFTRAFLTLVIECLSAANTIRHYSPRRSIFRSTKSLAFYIAPS